MRGDACIVDGAGADEEGGEIRQVGPAHDRASTGEAGRPHAIRRHPVPCTLRPHAIRRGGRANERVLECSPPVGELRGLQPPPVAKLEEDRCHLRLHPTMCGPVEGRWEQIGR